jgi:Rrf2 family protein
MIRFSRSEDYAIVIVGTLARAYKKRLVPLSEIAEEYAISSLFLRNLANELRIAGIIKAVEGKNGGYYLLKDPRVIKMGEILSIFSKKQHLVCCSMKSSGSHKRVCPKEQYCFAGNIWRQLNKEFIDKIYSLSLESFLEYKAKTTS